MCKEICPKCHRTLVETKTSRYCETCGYEEERRTLVICQLIFLVVAVMGFVISGKTKAIEVTDNVKYMAEAIYHESRDQVLAGQVAVGCVIKNRMETDKYYWGDTAKEIVHQPKQFSYYSDGKPETFNDKKSYFLAITLANHVLTTDACEFYGNIDHFINHEIANIRADWFNSMRFVMTIGGHSFYRSK